MEKFGDQVSKSEEAAHPDFKYGNTHGVYLSPKKAQLSNTASVSW